jgi:CRP-like cAMP-binding protein
MTVSTVGSMAEAATERLVRKLESIGDLSPDEKCALLALPVTVRQLGGDEDIVREGDRPSQCCLIIDGFACRYVTVRDGGRQIMSFHTPGDMPDLQSLHLKVMDHSVMTLVRSDIAFIQHQDVRALCRAYPGIASLLWRDTLIDAAIFRAWMAGLGRKDASARLAHLLCELAMRYKAVGLTSDHSYKLPLTQAEIGDALGLSVVHVNRVLRELRERGLVTFQAGTVTPLDWEGLKTAGEFDPLYLHLDRKAAS